MSPRVSGLGLSGKIKKRSLAIFGTGDSRGVKTVTANVGFVRAAKGQGVDIPVVIHESRALTEAKMHSGGKRIAPLKFPVLFKDIGTADFRKRFLESNTPVLIKKSCGIMQDWPCVKNWTDKRGEPNLEALQEAAGGESCVVPVYDCDQRYFNSQGCSDMAMKDYLSYWRGNREGRCLYLKDWHFFKIAGNDLAGQHYQVPNHFKEDWLNEFLVSKEGESDYRFVYVGPEGTWTPFHRSDHKCNLIPFAFCYQRSL